MQILLIAKAYPPETGGVETYSEQVAMAWRRAGHEVTVLTAHPGARGETLRDGIPVINVGQGAQAGVFRRMMGQLWRMRNRRFDMIHATTWRVALPVLLLRRKTPLVVSIHGREVFMVPGPLRPLLVRVLRHAALLPTVSKAIIDKARKSLPLPDSKTFACWNGISFPEESAEWVERSSSGRLEIFDMCRLVPRKNVDGAIRAVARLVRAGRDVRFRIAGGGPESEKLADLILEEGMADHIELLGRVPDEAVEPLYRESHVFLHPQIATEGGGDLEGFGLSIADAMAFGVVAVAGASGGPTDFIETGRTGYLVDGTDLADIENALLHLLDNRAEMAAVARAGWEMAHRDLTWDRHVERISERFDSRDGGRNASEGERT